MITRRSYRYLIIVILICRFIILVALSSIILILGTLLASKPWRDQEKSSPFECGFIPSTNFRVPFSLHFFLITILFLVFDVELVLLFPYLLWPSSPWIIALFFSFVIIFLTIGLIFEWCQSILEWRNLLQSLEHFAVNKERGLPWLS